LTKADWKRLYFFLGWQSMSMINMAIIIYFWKGWENEKFTSKGGLILGTLQTIFTLVIVVLHVQDWLKDREMESGRKKD
jgi:formate-dependent nitrite reductase membrane component NrfD